jgi:XTP/dITP diphosphohydrolase
MPKGYNKTFAELGEDVKNSISHRARAIKELVDFLQS